MFLLKTVSILLFIAVALLSCNNSAKENNLNNNPIAVKNIELKYAKEFKIEHDENSIQISIHKKGTQNSYKKFRLVKSKSEIKDPTNTVKVPCEKIICLSSTQLSYFFELNAIDKIVGINSSRYLKHPGIKQRIASGKVKRIGKEGHFNIETIAALDPDIIFVSPFKAGGFDALKNLGIPLIPMAAYSENTPLGRAEWIKMIALFIGKTAKADSIYNGIEQRYLQLKKLTVNVEKRPTVFSGKMKSGSWYVPGGNSFYAHYFRDAGASYIIQDDKKGAYPLDYETLYSKAANCDFWRIIYPEKRNFTQKDLKNQDERYADFKAFNNKNILFCNIREKPYREQAAIKPDVLLADYIHFFHPQLLPNYKPVFYERLK
jgi:iron complex transport system substrate-binding protein